jgi:outer membrane protein TolC
MTSILSISDGTMGPGWSTRREGTDTVLVLTSNWAAELSPARAIPALAPVPPIGIPSDLLRRRPGIRQAERNLAAATAQVGVATAQLFPQFSVTG